MLKIERPMGVAEAARRLRVLHSEVTEILRRFPDLRQAYPAAAQNHAASGRSPQKKTMARALPYKERAVHTATD